MPATNQGGSASRALISNDWTATWKPFGEALEQFSTALDNATAGVGFFDQRLRCQALNRAFAATWSLPTEKFLGNTLHQLCGAKARRFKAALERTFSGGAVISNVGLFGASSQEEPTLRRAASFYPFADDRGRVRVAAVTICEASTLEFHLGSLVSKLQMALPAAMCLLGASFPEVLARCLQSSTRSIRMLRSTMSPRSILSGTQLEIGLMPLALFLSLTGSRSPAPVAMMPVPATDRVPPPDPDVPEAQPLPDSVLPEDPSPRESQVLRLLAIGRSNKEIGIALGISTRTVETYRARIIRKLGLHSTAELVRYAIRNKIIEL